MHSMREWCFWHLCDALSTSVAACQVARVYNSPTGSQAAAEPSASNLPGCMHALLQLTLARPLCPPPPVCLLRALRDIHGHMPSFPNPEPGGKAIDFRRLLLNKCQAEFESGSEALKAIKAREEADAKVGVLPSWISGSGFIEFEFEKCRTGPSRVAPSLPVAHAICILCSCVRVGTYLYSFLWCDPVECTHAQWRYPRQGVPL